MDRVVLVGGTLLVAASSLLAGCGVPSDTEARLLAEVRLANARAAAEGARVAALEARLERVEHRAAARANAAPPDPAAAAVIRRLDELIALNHELLVRSDRAAPVQAEPGGARSVDGGCEDLADPEQRLRALVQRLHGHSTGFRGGLSRDQAEALRVLLRKERSLDDRNPLREW